MGERLHGMQEVVSSNLIGSNPLFCIDLRHLACWRFDVKSRVRMVTLSSDFLSGVPLLGCKLCRILCRAIVVLIADLQ